jgi:hypothetical protein
LTTLTHPDAHSASRGTDSAPAAEETVAAHAKRALLTRVRGRITRVLDAGIALLQKLRTKAGGPPMEADESDRPGARRDRMRERDEPAAAEAAPKPNRRLRAFLIYLSFVLVGCIAGSALAYHLFQKQLGALLAESQRLDQALAEKSRPSADILKAFETEQARRIEAEKKLAAAFADYTESTAESYSLLESLVSQQVAEAQRLEASLAENAESHAATRKTLDEAEAGRIEAEEKLAATLAEHVGPASTQRAVTAADTRGNTQRVEPLAPGAPLDTPASRRDSSPPKSGNCTLDTRNVEALKDCVSAYNR